MTKSEGESDIFMHRHVHIVELSYVTGLAACRLAAHAYLHLTLPGSVNTESYMSRNRNTQKYNFKKTNTENSLLSYW